MIVEKLERVYLHPTQEKDKVDLMRTTDYKIVSESTTCIIFERLDVASIMTEGGEDDESGQKT